jgi:hypothetical protein
VFVEGDDGYVLKKLDDLADQMVEIMKDFDKTEKEFRKGFRFREVDINGDIS